MNKGLLIGGTVLGGGLLYLATREREAIGGMVAEVYEAQKEGIRQVAKAARRVMSGISQKQLDRISKYNIGPLVEKYRGGLSWGLAMAMMEHESDFEPDVFNYKGADGKLRKGYYKGPGTREPKGGANGLYQIMTHYFKDYGIAEDDFAAAFDPETNIRAALKARNRNLADIAGRLPAGTDASVLDRLVYMAHVEGLGKVQWGLKQLAKTSPITWAAFSALPWLMGTAAWKAAGGASGDKVRLLYNRFGGFATVGDRAAVWEQAKPEIMKGS